MKGEVVALHDQYFYRIFISALGWNENSTLAGDFHFSWMTRGEARVRQHYRRGLFVLWIGRLMRP
jgi:hypothetical protein